MKWLIVYISKIEKKRHPFIWDSERIRVKEINLFHIEEYKDAAKWFEKTYHNFCWIEIYKYY